MLESVRKTKSYKDYYYKYRCNLLKVINYHYLINSNYEINKMDEMSFKDSVAEN